MTCGDVMIVVMVMMWMMMMMITVVVHVCRLFDLLLDDHVVVERRWSGPGVGSERRVLSTGDELATDGVDAMTG